MKTKTWIILAAVVLSAVGLTLAIGALQGGVAVESATVETGPIRQYIDERAKTRLPNTYLITMPCDGRIEPITLTEGTRVNQGDPVAQVVRRDLELATAEATAGHQEIAAAIVETTDKSVEEITLKQAWEFVTSMRATVAAAAARTKSSKAGYDFAGLDLTRAKQLMRSGAGTEQHLERAELQRIQSEMDYRQSALIETATRAMEIATELLPKMIDKQIAKKKLAEDVLRQQEARADALRQQALLNLERGSMTSPVDGVVLRRRVTNERPLTAGTVLLEIGRPEDLEIEADLLSLDVVDVRQGAIVEIYGPAIGTSALKGKVHRVEPAGFTKISSLGVEQQRVKVIIRFDSGELQRLTAEHNRHLGVGYRVRVRIVTAEKPKALIVPRSALFRGTAGGWQVFAVVDGRAQVRDVKIGLLNDRSAEVLSGLSQGDEVVLAPESDLEDGTRVELQPKSGS
ncbi:MAG: HlyD family efflux transporter periplasmic adaptor subunit [Candidatus Nealsonbacteria bacterium]|nr:HlyD family efflux transporter periplasmic adaptor subunit [Candidatus Nealsonbacteria bacterium]